MAQWLSLVGDVKNAEFPDPEGLAGLLSLFIKTQRQSPDCRFLICPAITDESATLTWYFQHSIKNHLAIRHDRCIWQDGSWVLEKIFSKIKKGFL